MRSSEEELAVYELSLKTLLKMAEQDADPWIQTLIKHRRDHIKKLKERT